MHPPSGRNGPIVRSRRKAGGGCGGGHESRYAIATPRPDTPGIHQDAEDVGRNEPVLAGVPPDQADDHAVDGGNHQAHPMFAANHKGGEDSEQAGKII
jgi:hypothetical protein